ncbi:MAG: class I SAM-dependent methyltransferase [Bradymonadaceae bacterium]
MSHHKFDPVRLFRLERPERHAQLRPGALLDVARVGPGMIVVDVGCGTGFFSMVAAERVGPTGRVIALDIAEAMLEFLRKRDPPPHVEVLRSEESALPVSSEVADVVVLGLVLHEAVDPPDFLGEVRRVLRPGGVVLCLEWKAQREERGPRLEDRVDVITAKSWFNEARFEDVATRDWTPSHYVLSAVRGAGNSEE